MDGVRKVQRSQKLATSPVVIPANDRTTVDTRDTVLATGSTPVRTSHREAPAPAVFARSRLPAHRRASPMRLPHIASFVAAVVLPIAAGAQAVATPVCLASVFGERCGGSADSLDAPRARAHALEARGRDADALSILRAASSDAPANPDLYLDIARVSDRLGRKADALDAYRRFAALEPAEPRGHELLGWFYLEVGKHDDALQEFRKAVQLAPTRPAAHEGVGIILVTLGRNEEALRAFSEAARLDPRDATLWGQMALAAEAVNRPKEAISYWERALRETPGYFDTRPDERRQWESAVAQQGPQPAADVADADTGASSARPATATSQQSRGRVENASYTSSGSGFVVSRDGMILTNKHVVRGCDALRVRGDSGTAVRARVVAVDSSDDLALLQAQGAPWPVATFRAGPQPRPGDDVVAVGYPLNGLLADQVNVTVGTINALAGMYNDQHQVQMSAPVQPGSSGGPLFDASGNVVGIVVTKLNAKVVAEAMGDIPQNVNFAIKGSIARTFLEARGVAFGQEPSTKVLSHADVGDIGRKVTVLVECWQ